jgi:hypothetical protein
VEADRGNQDLLRARLPHPAHRLRRVVHRLQVPSDRISAIADFDGSVIVERTAGEVSARCHDEQANFLALNLAHDIITGARTVQEAREYYGAEFLDARRKKPTPYMERLRFDAPAGGTADPDVPIISDEELERAAKEGESG